MVPRGWTFALFVLALLAIPCVGYSFDSITYSISIINETASDEEIEFTIINDENTTLDSFNHTFSGSLEVFSVLMDGQKPSYELHPLDERGSRVQLRVPFSRPIDPGDRSSFIIKVRTHGHVEKVGDGYMFSRSFGFKKRSSLFKSSVYLPIGAMLPTPGKEEAPALFFPLGDISHDGRRLKLSWAVNDLGAREPFVTFILYEFPPEVTTIVKTVLIENNDTRRMLDSALNTSELLRVQLQDEQSTKLMLSSFLLLETVALALIAYFHLFSRARAAQGVSSLILDSLDEDEACVLSKVVEQVEPITQREIQDILGFSKAKLSRTLDRLEAKGFIKKVRCGRTNKVHVTEKALR